MKRLLISICAFFLILTCNYSVAQEKVKSTEDKTKVKDKDADYKSKEKDNKVKVKDGDNKMKTKNPDAAPMSTPTTDQATVVTTGLPYTANYSSNFTMGNPNHAKMILDLWKDWDDNAFTRHDYMADTLVMYFPDGTMVKGKQANMDAALKYRGTITSAKSTLDAWMPLRSVDKNEDWVALWGTETDTFADGKVQKRDIHEIWRINKDGKVDFMKQFTAVPSPQQ
jgi:hypothetical protein